MEMTGVWRVGAMLGEGLQVAPLGESRHTGTRLLSWSPSASLMTSPASSLSPTPPPFLGFLLVLNTHFLMTASLSKVRAVLPHMLNSDLRFKSKQETIVIYTNI